MTKRKTAARLSWHAAVSACEYLFHMRDACLPRQGRTPVFLDCFEGSLQIVYQIAHVFDANRKPHE
jgi:hypothetical protein